MGRICRLQKDTDGITKITLKDVELADKIGYTVKLIGYAEKKDKLFVWVSPMLVKKSCPLSGASGVFNAILVEGNYLGTSMFYGQGAGKHATASAIVADVIESVRHINANKAYIDWIVPEETNILPIIESENRYFVRTTDGEEKIKALFSGVDIYNADGESFFITDIIKEKDFDEKIKNISLISAIKVLNA